MAQFWLFHVPSSYSKTNGKDEWIIIHMYLSHRSSISYVLIILGYIQSVCLWVGTETLPDNSKILKPVLMQPFEQTVVNQMLEGWIHLMLTMVLVDSILWIQPWFREERYALTVSCDISIYASHSAQATVGTSEIAMAIGPNASLPLKMVCHVKSFN